MTKFINHCNEVKAATAANKEGGQLSIVKLPPETQSKKKKGSAEAEDGGSKK